VALRNGFWKLILKGKESFEENPQLPEVFLADLQSDPRETRNLAAANPEILRQLMLLAKTMEQEVEKKR
jgi:arylsulfatase A-like enzyme